MLESRVPAFVGCGGAPPTASACDLAGNSPLDETDLTIVKTTLTPRQAFSEIDLKTIFLLTLCTGPLLIKIGAIWGRNEFAGLDDVGGDRFAAGRYASRLAAIAVPKLTAAQR